MNRPIAIWLFGVAGMVGGMVTVGGATRLTRSGLSMVTWKPHGGLPPMSPKEWNEEFDRYKQFPEYLTRRNMSVDEFKKIFYWEYGHRMLGRTVGLAFVCPLAYFFLRKKMPRELYGRMAFLFSLGAAQVSNTFYTPKYISFFKNCVCAGWHWLVDGSQWIRSTRPQ